MSPILRSMYVEDDYRRPFSLRANWLHFTLLMFAEWASAALGSLILVSSSVCESDGCNEGGGIGWMFIGISAVVGAIAWWVAEQRVMEPQCVAPSDDQDDGPALRLAAAFTLLVTPLVLIVLSEIIVWNEFTHFFFFAVAAAVVFLLIGPRLAWLMKRGRLRTNKRVFRFLVMPAVILVVGSLVQFVLAAI